MAKKALVIGISKFDHFSNLACDRDLERVSQWLRDQGYGVEVVPDRFERDALETQPSQAGRVSYDRLDEVLHRFLAETVRGCEMAVVYIASHGCIKHPSRTKTLACLAASDTPGDSNAVNKSFDLADLADRFGDAPVGNLVGIFDFCHAGAIEELFKDVAASFRDKNYALLAACQTQEGARDTDEGGVFTTALLEGLRPERADAQGEITVRALCDFVQRRLQNSGQNPLCFAGNQPLALGRYERAEIEAARAGHAAPVDPQPERVLEPPAGFRRVAELVDQAQSIQPSQTQFYEATAPHWSDIKANCDAPRDLYAEVKQFAVERLDPKHWAIGLPDENLGFRQPSVPLGVIVGRGGEGKSTLLMRVAADLAAEGYEVWWREERLSGLNVAALATMPQPNRPVLVCADELLPGDEEELRAGLMQLYRQTVPLVLLGTVRQELWRGQIEGRTKREAEIVRFEFGDLSQPELGAIVAKLEAAGRLGQLAELEPDKRVEQLLTKADGQLLILLCEVFDREGIKALVQKNLDALKKQQPDGACVVEACEYVALLHSFGLEMPHTRIGQLLALKTEFEYIEKVLEKTQGFLEIRRTAEADWLRTRHAVVADIVVQQLGHGIYDRISYFLKTDLDHFSGELIRPFLKALFSQWQIRQLDIVLLRRILANLNRPSPVQKIILTIWATLEASLDEFGTARTLFQQAAEADLSDARTLQPWALMEKKQGQIERARDLFAQAAQADPRHAPVYQAWALMEKEQGQIERARELFELASQADPSNAPTLQAWALFEKEQRNPDRARELFELASQADPSNAPTLQAWALFEKEQRNPDRARALFERASQADPSHAPTLQAWALFEKEQRNPDRARALFERASQADPSHAPTLQAWALFEKEQRNPDRARALFERASQADPSHAPTLQAWALFEKEQRNPDRARALFERASQADPSNALVWQAWALFEKEQRNPDRARELFERASQANPSDAPTLQAWALFEKEQRNPDRARALFERASQADPSHAPTLQAWALFEKEQRNPDRARELFERASQADPSHAPVWQAWALFEKEQRNPDRARALFERASQADPSHAPTLQAWALFEKEQHNPDRARELFERASQADPSHAPVWQAWALFEKEQRNPDRARELFERAFACNPRDGLVCASLAKLEAQQQNWDQALTYADRAIAAKHKKELYRQQMVELRAEIHLSLGNAELASADFRYLDQALQAQLKQNPRSFQLLINRVKHLIRWGHCDSARWAEAATLLDQADQRADLRQRLEVLNLQGEVAQLQGDRRTALAYWDSALRHDPTFAPARQNRDRA